MRLLAGFFATLACCAPAIADVLQADERSGTLTFSAMQAGAKFTGGFGDFQASVDFDPATPAQGKLHVTVETASIDTQDAERDEILRSQDFFWAGKHPQAIFHAERFEREAAGFKALGELTIRGKTRPSTVRFTLAPGQGGSVMKGSASLRRLEFGLGQGDWQSTEWVGDPVEVQFELKLKPAASASIG